LVKAPGQVTLTCYAACGDITRTVTPDLKAPGLGQIVWVNLGPSSGPGRLGGSALARVLGQLGDEAPDLTDPDLFRRCFHCIQVNEP